MTRPKTCASGVWLRRSLFAFALLLAGAAAAVAQSYTLNGMPVDAQTHYFMESAGLAPGHYWLLVDGSWGVVGDPRPLGNIYGAQGGGGGGVYVAPGPMGGSGEWNSQGDWSYYSPHAGGGVGGTGDGCVYAFGWSNC